jgi:hypothetical protein
MSLFMKHIISLSALQILFTGFLFSQKTILAPHNNVNGNINIFLDCPSGCDWDYIRLATPYLNYVREIRDAQLYLLITTENNANGGKKFTLYYHGYKEFVGMKDTLIYNSSVDDSDIIIRHGLIKTIALGIMRYVARTPISDNIAISYDPKSEETAEVKRDKWNMWIFELDTKIQIEKEQNKEELQFDNSISAYKITPKWKLEHRISREYNFDTYLRESTDDETGKVTRTRIDVEKNIWNYRSINNHWSVGLRTRIGADNTKNLNLEIQVYPAIEYNLFPYNMSSHKQMRFMYSVGYTYNDYLDTTIYDVMKDRLFEQKFDVAMQIRQKWGSTNFSLNASSFVPDFSRNMFRAEGDIRIRMFRGLEFNVRLRASLIHNQIGIPKGELTAEELFLNLRELKTTYRWDIRTGIIYTFGSLYNNIVNPRFGN